MSTTQEQELRDDFDKANILHLARCASEGMEWVNKKESLEFFINWINQRDEKIMEDIEKEDTNYGQTEILDVYIHYNDGYNKGLKKALEILKKHSLK